MNQQNQVQMKPQLVQQHQTTLGVALSNSNQNLLMFSNNPHLQQPQQTIQQSQGVNQNKQSQHISSSNNRGSSKFKNSAMHTHNYPQQQTKKLQHQLGNSANNLSLNTTNVINNRAKSTTTYSKNNGSMSTQQKIQLLAGVGNNNGTGQVKHNNFMNNEDLDQIGISGQQKQKRSSLNNHGMMLGTLIMNSSQAVGGVDSYSSNAVSGQKDFFNQTAPINMKNFNKLYPGPSNGTGISDEFAMSSALSNNFVTTGGPSSSFNHQDLIMSNQNLKRLSSKDSGNGNTKTNFHSSYYTQATAPMTNPKKQKEKISLSPSKTTQGKKQILIQSILNQMAAKQQQMGGKQFLNLTLQNLVANQQMNSKPEAVGGQHSLMQSQEILQKVLRQHHQLQQTRLNKTLDNLCNPLSNDGNQATADHNYLSSQQQYQGTQQQYAGGKSKTRIGGAPSNQSQIATGGLGSQTEMRVSNGGGGRSQSKIAKGSQYSQGTKGTQSSHKSKFSSTMRVSDFNQTQQLVDLKSHLQGPPPPTHQHNHYLPLEDYIKNVTNSNAVRKSKNTQMSTQNIQFYPPPQHQAAIDNHETDLRKQSALSIYTSAQGLQNSNAIKSAKKKLNNTSNNQVGATMSKPQFNEDPTSKQLNEREILKKMMNFYQDDFLHQFNVKGNHLNQAMVEAMQNRQNMNMTQQQIGEGVNNQQINQHRNSLGNKMFYSASKTKNQQAGAKHKANSTLNQYLQLQGSNQKFNNQANHIQEPPISNSTLTNSRPATAIHKGTNLPPSSNDFLNQTTTLQDILGIGSHPYCQPRRGTATSTVHNKVNAALNHHHPSAGSNEMLLTNQLNMMIANNLQAKKQTQQQLTLKDFQNKTQPIPKSILEMGAQIGSSSGPANISTGTRGSIGNHNQRATSKDSINKGNNKESSNIKISSGSGAPQRLNAIQINQNRQKKQSAVKYIEEDPSEVYKDKRPQILDEPPLPIDSQSQPLINRNEGGESETSVAEDAESCSSSSDGNRKLARYSLGKQVGQGAYAVVRIATCKRTGQKFAIKVYDKSKLTDSNRQRSVRREIRLLQKMNHPNIVKIYEAFETDDHVYLVMEYVGGGSLHTYIRDKQAKRLEEEDAKRIFKQMMTALQYCHRKSIAHRDIKLENILLDEHNNVKLIDFGFSTCIPNDKKIKMFCGTPSYMAPEIVLKEEYAGPPADIWASAVLLYALMNGCFPFRGQTDKELYRRIQRGSFVLHNQSVTDAFVNILSRMLNTNADNRPTADDILQDQWFQIDSSSQAAQIQAQKNQAESIADQRRQFKAKILGKIPVEKIKNNTICLNGQQPDKNGQQQVQISGSGTIASGTGTQQTYHINPTNNNDFSDYGVQHQNVIKKLNQEAYQAYYNTSGANFGMSGSGTVQNPYYNNFFQHNFLGNMQQQNNNAQNNGMGFYPFNNNNNVRTSPSKNPAFQQSSNPQNIPQYHQQQQPQPSQQEQPSNANNQVSSTQVFGSPTTGTAFHCAGGLINNNFNIINNIIMGTNNQSQKPGGSSSQPSSSQNNQGTQRQVGPQMQVNNNNPSDIMVEEFKEEDETGDAVQNNAQNPIEDDEEGILLGDDDLDEDIVDSIANMGFNRSQVVTQIIGGNASNGGGTSGDPHANSQIGQIYLKMKEEKMSKTSQQHRGMSMQALRKPNRLVHAAVGKHNFGIFPNFVPSIPDDNNSLKKDDSDVATTGLGTQKFIFKNAYYDDIQNDDYRNVMLLSGQKSPKSSNGTGSRFNQTQYPLFPVNNNAQQPSNKY